MMTGPGDEVAAGTAGRGRLRASHAEREQAIEVLKAAFVQGRLTKDEFDARAGQALTARTCADLAAVTGGFPAGPTASRPPGKPARMKAPPPGSTELKTGVRVIIATTALTAGAWVGAWFARAHEGAAGVLVFISTLVWLGMLILTATVVAESCRQRHSGGQLPPRPAPGAAARYPSARHPPPRPGSSRGSITVSTPPKRPEAIAPIRNRPARRHRIDGVLAGAATRSAMPVIDPGTAKAARA
jgi:uncharacterized membrane protein